ncbi:unnamed protein product [Pieris macdunnoughi]|uniref:Uncharacterized protein n=1 Tax=Pieris macdunnoughi TaxID=345717 RepID=A0A821UVA3_9NEOP|nr:unnamed protein product [Pieris macdunnoughi]
MPQNLPVYSPRAYTSPLPIKTYTYQLNRFRPPIIVNIVAPGSTGEGDLGDWAPASLAPELMLSVLNK